MRRTANSEASRATERQKSKIGRSMSRARPQPRPVASSLGCVSSYPPSRAWLRCWLRCWLLLLAAAAGCCCWLLAAGCWLLAAGCFGWLFWFWLAGGRPQTRLCEGDDDATTFAVTPLSDG